MIVAVADWVAQWPNILIVLVCTGLLLLLLPVAYRLGRLLPGDPEVRATAALDTFKVLGPLAGVFLSFSLVQAIGQFRVADANVSREAANIYQLDRAMAGIASLADTRPARLALRDYLRALLNEEWPGLRRGGGDAPQTSLALARLQGEVEELVATFPADVRMSNDIDRAMDDVQEDRAARLAIAHGGLPAVMWWVLACLFGLLFACAAFLQGANERHPLPVLYVAGLGLLASLLFIMDRPFQGDLSVSPAPLVKVQAQLEARMR